MSDYPLHEVVLDGAELYARGGVENHRKELAAYIKAADAYRHTFADTMELDEAYDTAAADLRRVLEGK